MLSNKNHLKLIAFNFIKLHNFATTFLYLYVFKYFVEQITLRVSLDTFSHVCFNIKCLEFFFDDSVFTHSFCVVKANITMVPGCESKYLY